MTDDHGTEVQGKAPGKAPCAARESRCGVPGLLASRLAEREVSLLPGALGPNSWGWQQKEREEAVATRLVSTESDGGVLSSIRLFSASRWR